MFGTVWGLDFDHVSQWVMVVVCLAAGWYWFVALKTTVRLAIPRTVFLTAVLLAVSLWTAFAFAILALDTEHDVPTALWLRPSVGIYIAASVARSAMFQPLVVRVLNLAEDAKKEIEADD